MLLRYPGLGVRRDTSPFSSFGSYMNRMIVLIVAGLTSACAAENLSSSDMAVTPSAATAPQDPSLMRAIDVVDAATGGNNYLPQGAIQRAIAESLEAHGLLVEQGWFSNTPSRYNLALNIQGYRIEDGDVRFEGKYLLIDTEEAGKGPAWTTTIDASRAIRDGEDRNKATERALRENIEAMLSRLHEKPPIASSASNDHYAHWSGAPLT
jgi:hypothetical protein